MKAFFESLRSVLSDRSFDSQLEMTVPRRATARRSPGAGTAGPAVTAGLQGHQR